MNKIFFMAAGSIVGCFINIHVIGVDVDVAIATAIAFTLGVIACKITE